MRRAALAWVIATMALIAGVSAFGVWLLAVSPGGQQSESVDGPTLYQALAIVNSSVSVAVGGPWTLFGIWGIASPLPFSPGALGWPMNNATANNCSAQFNGLTIWNGSIPLFTGSFDSGTAPFWQFAYFSNTSHGLLIATNILGVAYVYSAMGMDSPCARATSLGAAPWSWAITSDNFPANSPTLARSAWEAGAGAWSSSDSHGFEAFVLGFNWWGSGNPGGNIVRFGRCGVVGFTGIQPFLDVSLNGNGSWNSNFQGTQGCGDVMSLGPPPVYASYSFVFSSQYSSKVPNGTATRLAFQVAHGNASTGMNFDAGGLVSWMSVLALKSSVGSALPSVPSGCPNWVASLSECVPSESGWYAVLLSATGGWLDSYPSQSNATAWPLPNVSIVSNQILVLVAPSGWNLSDDSLQVASTIQLGGEPAVTGLVGL